MKGVVRTTAINLAIVLSPFLACLLVLMGRTLIDPNVWHVVELLQQPPLSSPILICAFATGAVFGWLQLRTNHPWCRAALARWCILAGWDGQRSIRHLAIRLHWSEIVAVGLLLFCESQLCPFSAGQRPESLVSALPDR